MTAQWSRRIPTAMHLSHTHQSEKIGQEMALGDIGHLKSS